MKLGLGMIIGIIVGVILVFWLIVSLLQWIF